MEDGVTGVLGLPVQLLVGVAREPDCSYATIPPQHMMVDTVQQRVSKKMNMRKGLVK